MAIRAITPEEARASAEQLKLSPAIISGNHVFLSGVTGSDAQGGMAEDPEAQFRNAFDKIGGVLGKAGLTFAAVVEMTSYHIGLRGHFDLFNKVRLDYVKAPYPAWTAVEVAGLRREGALVEIRVIAASDPDN
ncbi:RidA family protein [Profundibacter sp.]|uniref:RidA family protein n=1 Tax=Profundibacter sp. TaxID=3101071 RepID=UPI003D0BE56B